MLTPGEGIIAHIERLIRGKWVFNLIRQQTIPCSYILTTSEQGAPVTALVCKIFALISSGSTSSRGRIAQTQSQHSPFQSVTRMHSESTPPVKGNISTHDLKPSENGTITRTLLTFDASLASRFRLPKKKRFAPQYAHIYYSRLTQLRQHLVKTAHRTFGPPSELLRYAKRIVDASNHAQEADIAPEMVIMGVIFRQMSSKPSILKLYDEPSHDLIPSPPAHSTAPYPGDTDNIFLEDEYGRCTFDASKLQPLPDAFVTGFVVALRGKEDRATGTFRVSDYASVLPNPLSDVPTLATDQYICVVSSLNLSATNLRTELLIEFLKGCTGDKSEEEYAAKVGHLIIAGNVTSPATVPPDHRPLAVGDKERVADPILEVDRILSELASSIPLSLMPGENDPANALLPQQPLHRCLLPSSSRNSNLTRAANPYACHLGGRVVLATSGQNVSDFALYSKNGFMSRNSNGQQIAPNGNAFDTQSQEQPAEPTGERVIDILESMLNNRHIAPTCPDTLGSYPFYETDPFVLDRTPHVFLAGNQAEFATRAFTPSVQVTEDQKDAMQVDDVTREQMVRLISVPRFDRSGQAVFVNMRTLDCVIREFAISI